MSGGVAERDGVRHLLALAQRPRPAGSVAEQVARNYASRTLSDLGFNVHEEPFAYSAFPGRYATPIGGATLALTLALVSGLALRGYGVLLVAGVLALGVSATALFARFMLRDGVLTAPWLRTNGVNLVATRGVTAPRVWLLAHLDSKSQPVPSAARVAGVVLLVVGVALSLSALLLTLVGINARMVWWGAIVVDAIGALPVMASVVGSRSDGAVDNASGVAAVLAAAALMRPELACGILLPSAEELGLAGARAWARTRAVGIALNCDGVDDDGDLVIMYNHHLPPDVVDAVRANSRRVVTVRRMPLGLLTDSSALAAHGWSAVTVSHGSLATLRRVHTRRDSLAHLRGDAIDDVAVILARAAEALAS